MADLAKYVVRLEAETAKYKRGLDRANRQLGRFQKRQTRQLDFIKTAFVRLAGPVAIGAVITKSIRLADEFNQLSIRIKTATKDTGDFVSVQKELVGISTSTGASLKTVVDTFQAFSRIREDIGATNTQVIALSRTLGQLGVIGGTSAEAMNNGLRQFNQAIAAGVFRAEEFNSIVENVPELAARIAKGFGKTQGELRQMVISGRLFATDVVNNLLKAAPEIADEFEDIPVTLSRAFSALSTSIGSALSALDEATGTTGAMARNIQGIADRLSVLSGTASPIVELKLQVKDLAAEFATLRKARLVQRGDTSEIDKNLERVKLQLAGAIDALKFFQDQAAGTVSGGKNPADAVGKWLTDMNREFVDFRVKQQIALDKSRGNVSEWLDEMNKEFVEFRVNQQIEFDKEAEALAEKTTRMQAITERAAQNMQDAFAEFLFNPFEDGLKGMLRSFVDTIRRMVANQLALKIFESLGNQAGAGGIIGAIGTFIGGAATGANMARGDSAVVGEEGPELFTAGRSGQIQPAGGVTIVNHVDARGATEGAADQIAAALDLASARAVAQINQNRRQGRG